jgi:hypothetical protein
LGIRKIQQEHITDAITTSSESATTKQFAQAISKSNRLMAEDILRESGYMLPQSTEVHELLETLLKIDTPDFPKDTVKLLLNKLQKTKQ